MLFNSIEFAIFLPLVFILYWLLQKPGIRFQNLLLLAASYLFYGWWDYRFLSLIAFSSVVDYIVGIQLERGKYNRRILLIISLIVNLGFLGFFKYFNFFAESFADAFTLFGADFQVSRLEIILPVGISFYTFQTLSYSIDVYRRKIPACHDPIAFFSFVSFFPQLVAGPIERASNLLPQFLNRRTFNYDQAVDGMRQILWGLFKKMVVADNCAHVVNEIFSGYSDASGSTLFLGGVLFAFQIYGDFSGYSDIAIGTARLFGFSLMRNFAFPYFSRDIAEFWRRWHISLSTWFRDYLYIPLGGSRVGDFKKVRNTFVIFLVSGFWHGANWTFIVWGALHALYFLPLLLLKRNRTHISAISKNKYLPSIREALGMIFTFFLVVLAWVFFRAENLQDAFIYTRGIFTTSFFSLPSALTPKILLPILMLLAVEWINRDKEHGLNMDILMKYRPLRWVAYQVILILIIFLSGEQQTFIYFQF